MASTTERGYGARHQAERAKWERAMRQAWARGEHVMCARQGPKCIGKPIEPGQPWDLGHTDDRTAYTGPECVPCNRGAGGANGAKAVNERRQMTVREW